MNEAEAITIETFVLCTDIRPALDDEQALIINAWSKGTAGNQSNALGATWLYTAQAVIAERLLGHEGVTALVATYQYPDHVVGFIVHGPGRQLHWIFVKGDYRRQGIATQLICEAFGDIVEPITTTHKSRAIGHYKRKWNLVSDPRGLSDLCRCEH